MKVFSAKNWTTTQDRIFQESKLKKKQTNQTNKKNSNHIYNRRGREGEEQEAESEQEGGGQER